MHKRMMVGVVVIVAIGCGQQSAAFDGSYSGPLNVYSVCSDGTGGRFNTAFDWTLTTSGARLTTDTGAVCSGWTGVVSRDTASLDRQSCQPVIDARGVTTIESITGGVLTLNDFGDIELILQTHRAFSGTLVGFCDDAAVGVLVRLK